MFCDAVTTDIVNDSRCGRDGRLYRTLSASRHCTLARSSSRCIARQPFRQVERDSYYVPTQGRCRNRSQAKSAWRQATTKRPPTTSKKLGEGTPRDTPFTADKVPLAVTPLAYIEPKFTAATFAVGGFLYWLGVHGATQFCSVAKSLE